MTFRAILFAAVATVLAAPAAHAEEMAVVVNRTVYPGETVQSDMLEEVAFRRSKKPMAPVVQDMADAQGKVAKRTLLPGRLIPAGWLREAYLVESGKLVLVVFSQGGLTISMKAVPLESGSAGAAVKLRNPDSGKVFSGVVMADGTVRVSG